MDGKPDKRAGPVLKAERGGDALGCKSSAILQIGR